MKEIELIIASDNIEEYCESVSCELCKIREICNATGSPLPLYDQIRRLAEAE